MAVCLPLVFIFRAGFYRRASTKATTWSGQPKRTHSPRTAIDLKG
jgi:hypothetical protein